MEASPLTRAEFDILMLLYAYLDLRPGPQGLYLLEVLLLTFFSIVIVLNV